MLACQLQIPHSLRAPSLRTLCVDGIPLPTPHPWVMERRQLSPENNNQILWFHWGCLEPRKRQQQQQKSKTTATKKQKTNKKTDLPEEGMPMSCSCTSLRTGHQPSLPSDHGRATEWNFKSSNQGTEQRKTQCEEVSVDDSAKTKKKCPLCDPRF